MSLLSKLTQLVISNNNLTGGIPPFLGNITSMEVFSAVTNPLGGSIPDTLGLWKSLTGFASGGCNLYGSIPHSIFNLSLLVTFSSSENHLAGSLPSEIGNQLPKLEWLQLWGNKLTGVLPPSISNCSKLRFLEMGRDEKADDLRFINSLKNCTRLVVLDLYNCNLTGVLPVSIGVFANTSAFSVLGNNICGGLVTLELPKCKETGNKKKRFPFFLLLILIAPMLLVVLYCVRLFCKKKHNRQPSQSSRNERFLKVSYNELLKATDGFSTANLIGEGGFSSVYKGILDSDDDRFVAVKVLHLQNRGALKSFLAECEAWRNIRHRNLLKIITSCSSVDFQGNDLKALVYEFMPNGSVHDWLHSSANTSKLNLLQRINILKDVATALDYLHIRCQTTIVHGDLKPSNILLDDDMVVNVGDFGLARLLGTDLNQNNSTRDKGTIGYASPEYGIGSEMKSSGDVYSFGILLLEVMTAKKPTDGITEANAKKVEECLIATIKIGVSCSLDSPPQRMKIEIVVIELQRILDNLLTLTDDFRWLNPAPSPPKIYLSAVEEGDTVFDANSSSFYQGGEEGSIQKKEPQVKKRLVCVMCTKPS
ncbi:kinase-like domain-containing protein [Tanacetum coccineum]